MMYVIGIDTGGTCTDAVVYQMEEKKIAASGKSGTTHERLEIGIRESLRKLPRELVDQAAYLSLSTTLATNACVENKGGRVCLIFIGVKQKTVEETYQQYGFESTEFMRFLEADPAKGIAPEWEKLDAMLPEILEQYDSIAISQLMPRENNGQYEKDAKERILARKKLPVVCAYEIFKDLNVIKRGAGALLNARLIPVMERFFEAVHHVLEEEEISIPFFIMRSDGSLVSEQYSMQYPVETLLCGPTASVKGAMALMEAPEAVIIDMGGTTSDIALVTGQEPIVNADGVKVGQWETFVRGIEIDTFALGGDSHVRYKNDVLFLEDCRVMPISTLADQYPQVLEELKRLREKKHGSTRPLYEHLVQMKSLDGIRQHYSEQEQAICDALQEGPLGLEPLAKRVHCDVFNLNTERLEREGILLRSGFTPTDAMVLRGDRSGERVCEEAALLAAQFIETSVKKTVAEIIAETYRLVEEKLYCNLVRILWEHADSNYVKKDREQMKDQIMRYAKDAFAYRKNAEGCFFRNQFSTDAVLLGVGAPTHVFLKEVADALHTDCMTSEFSGVSNALGAVLGDACAYETIHIGVDYITTVSEESEAELAENGGETFIVYGTKKVICTSMEKAVETAEEMAKTLAVRKVKECGADEVYEVRTVVKENGTVLNYGGAMVLSLDVTACARGRFSV